MTLRVKSLDELGKGGWRVSGEPPDCSPVDDKPKAMGNGSGTKGAKDLPPAAAQLQKAVSELDDEQVPEKVLARALIGRFGAAAVPQLKGAIPGRRFSLDVGFPAVRLAIEVDGWEFHGKYLEDFKRDREKDKLLLLEGWRVLRFTAGEINKEIECCVETVAIALDICAAHSGHEGE